MSSLEAALHAFIRQHGFGRDYCVAYSGGLDSHVLLDLCVKLRQQQFFSLRAIHIHHGLSPEADQWLLHCQQVSKNYEVDFTHYALEEGPAEGESVEAFAREQRYHYLAKALAPEELLLTAQHQDDQAETLILQLLRGAGPKGLSAMPSLKPLGAGLLARPLLAFTRAELKVYAKAQQLKWVEDELNEDPRYSRNYIRQQILPKLKERWPTVTKALARAAEHCAEAEQELAQFAAEELGQVQGSKTKTLSVASLMQRSPSRQRLLLRYWFEQEEIALPSTLKLQQILQTVLGASWDSTPCVRWGRVELRRYQDDLYLLPFLSPHDPGQRIAWDLRKPLSLAGIGELEAYSAQGQGLAATVSAVEVRFRQGGEVYSLTQGQHHELKKFFQEQAIPPWQRDRLPLIYIQNELAAIPGYLLVDKFKAKSGEMGYTLIVDSTLANYAARTS